MTVSKVETNPPDFDDWEALHGLLTEAFAYMATRIDPPSSLLMMTAHDIHEKSRSEDLFLIRKDGDPIACLFGVRRDDSYYIGKLAAALQHRGQGLARALIEAAADHAQAQGIGVLELQTRVALTENHAAFAAMGFRQVGHTTHPGFDQPTSLTFRRDLSRP